MTITCVFAAAVLLLSFATPVLEAEPTSLGMTKGAAPAFDLSLSEDDFAEVDWDELAETCPDVVGWVDVPGTDVSCPIAQAPEGDPAFFNSHDASGAPSAVGCPFLDADCAEGGLMGSKNAVVQGHNITGGDDHVFAPLADFADEGFARDHREVLVQTRQEKARLSVFCVEVVEEASSTDTLVTSFPTQIQYERYRDERVAASRVVLDAGAGADRMWTFSTCSYWEDPEDERTVLHCSLEREGPQGAPLPSLA